MKLMRITLAAAAAAFLLSSTVAGACDGHKKTSDTASAEAKATSGATGCAKKAEGVQLTSGSGCAKGDKMAGSACCKKGGAAKAKMAGGCCAKGEPVMASIADTTDEASCKFKSGAVAFKGTVLCKHCDLKKADSCATMFRTESGCLFALSGDKASTLRETAGGGSKLVRVKGEVNDNGELVVNTFRVVRSLDSGASAM